ncbi:hypothetical protein ACTXT7_013350 [Hymenolepis weldensis]
MVVENVCTIIHKSIGLDGHHNRIFSVKERRMNQSFIEQICGYGVLSISIWLIGVYETMPSVDCA